MAIDPVCGMQVDEKTAAWKSEYNGKSFFFCSPGCKAAFEKEPERYAGEDQPHAGHERQGYY